MEFVLARRGVHHDFACTVKFVPFHERVLTTKELVLPSSAFLADKNVA